MGKKLFNRAADVARESFNEYQEQQRQEQEHREQERAEEAAREAAALEKRLQLEEIAWLQLIGEFPLKNVPTYTTYQIKIPAPTIWQPTLAGALLQALVERLIAEESVFRLGIVGTQRHIKWTLRVIGRSNLTATDIASIVQPLYPEAQVLPDNDAPETFPFYRKWQIFGPDGQREWFDHTLAASTIRAATDPLAAIIRTMEALQPGERLRYELFVSRAGYLTQKQIQQNVLIDQHSAGIRYVRSPMYYSSKLDVAVGQAVGYHVIGGAISLIRNEMLKNEMMPRFEDADLVHHLSKLTQPLLDVMVCLTLDTPDLGRLQIMPSVSAGIALSLGGNDTRVVPTYGHSDVLKIETPEMVATAHPYLVRNLEAREKDAGAADAAAGDNTLRGRTTFNLTIDEAAAFWHLPHREIESDKVNWKLPVPDVLLDNSEPGVAVGTLDGKSVKILDADRQYHMVVTGMIGMGKTTLAEHIIRQDIARGAGVAIVDPQGAMIERLLRTAIPPERMGDVVYLDLGDRAHPVPLNPLRVVGDATEEEVFEAVLWIFRSIYGRDWEEQTLVRLEATMKNILQVVLTDPTATPLDMIEIIDNETAC